MRFTVHIHHPLQVLTAVELLADVHFHLFESVALLHADIEHLSEVTLPPVADAENLVCRGDIIASPTTVSATRTIAACKKMCDTGLLWPQQAPHPCKGPA